MLDVLLCLEKGALSGFVFSGTFAPLLKWCHALKKKATEMQDETMRSNTFARASAFDAWSRSLRSGAMAASAPSVGKGWATKALNGHWAPWFFFPQKNSHPLLLWKIKELNGHWALLL